MCHSTCHANSIEEYTLNVMEAMECAGIEALPSSGGIISKKGRKNISGWDEYVKPYAQESEFWFNVMASAGKPIGGDLSYNMKQSKKQFKFAVRRLKRCSDKIQADRFVSELLKGGSNIFNEIRRFRGSKADFSS